MSMVTRMIQLSHLALFRRECPLKRTIDIIAWWEKRRIAYNAIVGAAGIVTIIISLSTAAITEPIIGEAIGLSDPPLFGLILVIAYAVIANVCYTGGWIVEIFSRQIWNDRAERFGEISFTIGTIFSVLITLLPAVVIAAIGAYRILIHTAIW